MSSTSPFARYFLGGQNDPALVSGPGFNIPQAPRTVVLSAEWRE